MVYDPMILQRTDSSSSALGGIVTACGVGGLISTSALTIWDGFRKNHKGLLY
ncbi:MAG: hypothetical protein AAF171_17800 [Cyanobacteria bacterium P01_A01_bin.116]